MKRTTVFQMAVTALVAAVIAVLGPVTIPIGPVPISLVMIPILLSVWVLEWPFALLSVVLYLLLGLVGLPVFSGFQGGLQKLIGPTGGYLIGYIPLVLIAGLSVKLFRAKPIPAALGALAGVALLYLLGTLWFMHLTGNSFTAALKLTVLPFILPDLLKIILAVVFGRLIRTALQKAGLLRREAEEQKNHENRT